MRLDNQQLRLRLHFDTELHFCIAESISHAWICAEPEILVLFFFSFLNIVHLLHTKETHGTCQISNIGFYDYKPFPSHNFYNKYTSTLSIGLFLDHSWWDIQVDLECPCLTSGKNRFMLHFCKIYKYIMMASAFCMNTVKGICFFENTFLNTFGLFYRSLHAPFQVQFLLIYLPMISYRSHQKKKKT